jgi:hypothetical protein
VDPPDDESGKFARLPASLREKAQRIATTLAIALDYFNYMRTSLSFTNDCGDALGGNAGPGLTSASDQRLKVLKGRIIRDKETEKAVKNARIAVRVSKRVYLAELIGRYIEETEARRDELPKKQRKTLLPKNRFTGLLFPETIKYKGRKVSKKNGKKMSKEEKDLSSV